jgi:hypothetical protein
MSNPLFNSHKRYVVQYLRPTGTRWIVWESDRLQSAFAIYKRAKRNNWRLGSTQGVYDRQSKCFIMPPAKSSLPRHLR